jgi:hypothetical protein
VTGWHRIDSAPRDGTYIRGRDAEGNIFLCRWYTRQEIAEFFADDDVEGYDSGWYQHDDSEEEEWPELWQPIEDVPT